MKIKTILYLVLAPILLFGSCQKSELNIKPDQIAYFEFEYVNYAWGYTHTGWIIDNLGEILGYKLPDQWVFPDSAGYISEIDLALNLSFTNSAYKYQISTAELSQKINLIPDAAKGKLSTPKYAMADAGGWAFYCYVWDSGKNKYRRILLDLKGDSEQFNKSSAARALVSWLEKVQKDL